MDVGCWMLAGCWLLIVDCVVVGWRMLTGWCWQFVGCYWLCVGWPRVVGGLSVGCRLFCVLLVVGVLVVGCLGIYC